MESIKNWINDNDRLGLSLDDEQLIGSPGELESWINLNNVIVWADAVRESRNSVHYGAEPSMPNTYEKIAALLIGCVPHLRLLYRIRSAAK